MIKRVFLKKSVIYTNNISFILEFLVVHLIEVEIQNQI
jgi:hypothetical protein